MTNETDTTKTTDEQDDGSLPPGVRDGLRDSMIPLATTDPTHEADNLDPVGERLGDAAIVGLGEATHGTREFFELKARLLRHLVLEHDVRAIGLESNLPETMALYDYVVHGNGDSGAALAALSVDCWSVETVRSMVEWLRAFNADRPLADRVRIYGFTGHATHGAVQRLSDHLRTVDPDFLAEIAADLAALDDAGDGLANADPSEGRDVQARIETAERVVQMVRTHLDEHRATHVDATGERAWNRARQYAAVLEQVRRKITALGRFEGDAQADYTRAEYLDRLARRELPGRTMAENVAWIRDQTDADTLVLWAQDAHLNRTSFTFPNTDASAPNLGRSLAQRHGEEYVAVGFSFARGAFHAVRETDEGVFEPGPVPIDGPVPGTLDAALDALGESIAFVDLRSARTDDRTAAWLAEPRGQFRTGGTYAPAQPADHVVEYVYADAFDGLCFVAETTPARPLDGVADDADGDHTGEGAADST